MTTWTNRTRVYCFDSLLSIVYLIPKSDSDDSLLPRRSLQRSKPLRKRTEARQPPKRGRASPKTVNHYSPDIKRKSASRPIPPFKKRRLSVPSDIPPVDPTPPRPQARTIPPPNRTIELLKRKWHTKETVSTTSSDTAQATPATQLHQTPSVSTQIPPPPSLAHASSEWEEFIEKSEDSSDQSGDDLLDGGYDDSYVRL